MRARGIVVITVSPAGLRLSPLPRSDQLASPQGRRSMSYDSRAVFGQFRGLRTISRYQWFVFVVVWLGWTLDAADFGLYSLVLRPAMIELLGGKPPLTDIGKYGGPLAIAGAC